MPFDWVTRGLSSFSTDIFLVRSEPHGGPLGLIGKQVTKLTAILPYHPLYIRTQRTIQAFDSNKLHIAVKTPKNLSKSAFIRRHVVRRVRSILRVVLEERGWNYDGTVKSNGGVDKNGRPLHNLRGCYMIMTKGEPMIINVPADKIRQCCNRTVNYMLSTQSPQQRQRMPDPRLRVGQSWQAERSLRDDKKRKSPGEW